MTSCFCIPLFKPMWCHSLCRCPHPSQASPNTTVSELHCETQTCAAFRPVAFMQLTTCLRAWTPPTLPRQPGRTAAPCQEQQRRWRTDGLTDVSVFVSVFSYERLLSKRHLISSLCARVLTLVFCNPQKGKANCHLAVVLVLLVF